MPYRQVAFEAGECYHVYNRGNNRQRIFLERENYLFFLRKWRQYFAGVADVIAYCLMPNHYHFLLQLRKDDFSEPMQAFALSYTKALNQHHHRVGSVFQGRFRAVHVDDDPYLLHLSRYIHLNPTAAGLVARPEDWEFSSYRDFIGLRQGSLPHAKIVLEQLGSVERYRQFVESHGLGDSKEKPGFEARNRVGSHGLVDNLDISHLLLD
jgi:REP element-mobilizing transposase RayT